MGFYSCSVPGYVFVYISVGVGFVGMQTYSYTDETPLRCNPVLSIYATPNFFLGGEWVDGEGQSK